MIQKKRWVFLKHIVNSDYPIENHFDLLLEDRIDCLSWRLDTIPITRNASLELVQTPSHDLEWLEIPGRKVSGGRGWAGPVVKGLYQELVSNFSTQVIELELYSGDLWGTLQIQDSRCFLDSSCSINILR